MSNIDPKIREMVALGVAYSLNCHKCLKIHKQAAIKAGLTPKQMSQSINIAESVVVGASNLTKELVTELFGNAVEEERCCPAGSDCCP